jgi:hypothetical protein
MPKLVKGAKWAYGWVVVGPGKEIVIPPDAWREYGFQSGEEAILLAGSRRSGGFSVSTTALMAQRSERRKGVQLAILGRGRFRKKWTVVLPPEISVAPGDRLLAVRGSRYGLGFVARGPIYEEATRQSARLEVYGQEEREEAMGSQA